MEALRMESTIQRRLWSRGLMRTHTRIRKRMSKTSGDFAIPDLQKSPLAKP
jgi:hypothetical protein